MMAVVPPSDLMAAIGLMSPACWPAAIAAAAIAPIYDRSASFGITSLASSSNVVENLLKGHRPPSLCRCGVQKTVWELDRLFRCSYTVHG
jgi:hypothetical protein